MKNSSPIAAGLVLVGILVLLWIPCPPLGVWFSIGATLILVGAFGVYASEGKE